MTFPLLRHVVEDLAPTGCAVEFGVGSGASLRILAGRMFTVGFDSFAGLPERWRSFEAGSFAVRRPPTVPNSTLVVGEFADTLPGFDFGALDIGVVHVDCDLYSSTVTVLEHVGRWLRPGCFVVFDEFFYDNDDTDAGEAQAWNEFVARSHIAFDVIGRCGESLAIRIT